VYSLLLVCVLPLTLHTRPRVHWAPGIPHALFGRKINAQLGRIAPRDREAVFGIGVPSLRAKRSNPYLLSLRSKMDCFASLAMTAWLFEN
jgi:hypothetical protein